MLYGQCDHIYMQLATGTLCDYTYVLMYYMKGSVGACGPHTYTLQADNPSSMSVKGSILSFLCPYYSPSML